MDLKKIEKNIYNICIRVNGGRDLEQKSRIT